MNRTRTALIAATIPATLIAGPIATAHAAPTKVTSTTCSDRWYPKAKALRELRGIRACLKVTGNKAAGGKVKIDRYQITFSRNHCNPDTRGTLINRKPVARNVLVESTWVNNGRTGDVSQVVTTLPACSAVWVFYETTLSSTYPKQYVDRMIWDGAATLALPGRKNKRFTFGSAVLR